MKRENKKNGIYCRYIKRLLDILMALTGMLLLSWIYLIVAILVRIKLGKPVIFKQKRPGKIDRHTGKERLFTLYKFRSMKDATDRYGHKLTEEQRILLTQQEGFDAVSSDEERVTKFGRKIRELSLDEIPELYNILKGDMSFVGPRPLEVAYLPYYTEEERHRHDVLPGLTGLAQVNGRNIISWEERFRYDLEYVNNVSFLMDLRILCKTIAVVWKHDDTEIPLEGENSVALSDLRRNKE